MKILWQSMVAMVCVGLCAVAGVCSSATDLARVYGSGQSNGVGNVQGRVVADPGGQGIRKVIVELTGQNLEAQQDYTTATDATGQFRIEGVMAGEYSVSLRRAGYVRVNAMPEQARITVAAGQDVTELLYKMQATGVITGKITEADGDPLAGVSVWVTYIGKSGAPQSTDASEQGEAGQETTNDLGEYRIANLRAGRYIVQAQALGAGPAPEPSEKGRQGDRAVYALTYYPGTLEEKLANPVKVTSGGTAIANFGVASSRAFRVSGTVMMTGNPKNAKMFLVSTTGQTEVQELQEGGRFEFRTIMPGTYVANIVELNTVGEGKPPETRTQIIASPIVVSTSDVTGLQLQPEVGGSVGGKVRTEGEEKLDWADLSVTLVRVTENGEGLPQLEDIGVLGGTVSLAGDGSFEMKDVGGGKYKLLLGGESDKFRDYYMKSVMLDGREVADTGFALIGETTLEVVVSAKGASVEGTVVDSKGQVVAGATVVSLPNPGKLARPDLYQKERADASGHFMLRGMNPGSYTLVAVEGLQEDVRKPEFYLRYGAKGQAVDLDEGEKKSVTVTLAEGKE